MSIHLLIHLHGTNAPLATVSLACSHGSPAPARVSRAGSSGSQSSSVASRDSSARDQQSQHQQQRARGVGASPFRGATGGTKSSKDRGLSPARQQQVTNQQQQQMARRPSFDSISSSGTFFGDNISAYDSLASGSPDLSRQQGNTGIGKFANRPASPGTKSARSTGRSAPSQHPNQFGSAISSTPVSRGWRF